MEGGAAETAPRGRGGRLSLTVNEPWPGEHEVEVPASDDRGRRRQEEGGQTEGRPGPCGPGVNGWDAESLGKSRKLSESPRTSRHGGEEAVGPRENSGVQLPKGRAWGGASGMGF